MEPVPSEAPVLERYTGPQGLGGTPGITSTVGLQGRLGKMSFQFQSCEGLNSQRLLRPPALAGAAQQVAQGSTASARGGGASVDDREPRALCTLLKGEGLEQELKDRDSHGV